MSDQVRGVPRHYSVVTCGAARSQELRITLRASLVATLFLAAFLAATGCTSRAAKDASPTVMSGADLTPEVVPTEEPWIYDGQDGKLIRTANYRIYTTKTSAGFLSRLPRFLEASLAHYRTAIVPLEPPPLKLDTFIVSTRPQWERLTRQLMGEQADVYLKIRRGGYAWAGTAVLFDLGYQDTFATAAHEGWHQYRQRTFKQSPPIWLEEGVATFMEGYRWRRDAPSADGPSFLPWANVERFDALRFASSRERLMPLGELLAATPQEMLSGAAARPPEDGRDGWGRRGEPESRALTYYAQVWALTHFLNEGAEGRYRESLARLVSDAAEGRMHHLVADKFGLSRRAAEAACRTGPAVFQAYFNEDIAAAAAEYEEFVSRVAARGSRDKIVAGESPVGVAR